MWPRILALCGKVYYVTTDLGVATFLISVLVLLPLACFRSKRSFAGRWLVYASYVFATNQWMFSISALWKIWGWVGVLFGLALSLRRGISASRWWPGPEALAMAALLIHREWGYVGWLLLMICVTHGSRLGGLRLKTKAATG